MQRTELHKSTFESEVLSIFGSTCNKTKYLFNKPSILIIPMQNFIDTMY